MYLPLRRLVVALSTGWFCILLTNCAPAAEPAQPGESATPQFTAEQLDFFEKQIRPVLAEQCWGCHGAKKQEAGLRLDSRAAFLRGGDSGPIVVPGKPQESELLRVVRRTGDIKMPPERELPASAISSLTRWVEMALPWPATAGGTPAVTPDAAARSHWAFQHPQRPIPALTRQPNWSRSPLDSHILAALETDQLTPSPTADPRTLFRRVQFDLLGTLPEWDEVAEFSSDAGPDAYERLIDRLLARPGHGERWARHWLDVARYADNKGYVFFEEKSYPWAYTYRDYVIESFNQDLPFDQFVVEQIAADQVADPARPTSLRALGFLTLGAHFMNNTHDIIDDRVDVLTRGLMGLTATCARCHDHKFDPIPQADYYALYGVLRSCDEPLVAPLFAPPPDTEDYRKFVAELTKREQALGQFVQKKHGDLVTGARQRVGEYLMAAYLQRHQPATDDFMLIADTNDLNPTMVLRWRVHLEKAAKQPHPIWLAWHRFAALDESRFVPEAARVTAELAQATPENAILNPLVRQALTAKPPQTMNDVAAAYAELLTTVEKHWRERLAQAAAVGAAAPTQLDDPHEEQLRAVFYGPDAPPDVPVLIGWGFLTLLPDRASQGEYQKLLKEVESWMITGPGAPPRAHALVDSPQLYEPRVFLRGNPNRLGDVTPRQFLVVANPQRKPFTHGSGRIDLAREIVAPTNPLTARVLVNRLWMHHVGTPLVKTPGDFGLRSEPPTHPAVLDELATYLVDHGWSQKQLHREILLSATYRQQSSERPDGVKVDPDNRWYWRMNAQRLDFESLRDTLLDAAGSLDRRLGGPPLQLLGDAIVPRRSIYGFIDRMDVPSLLTTFDFPNPSQSNPLRDQTTVAPQALYLMNNNVIAELATRVVNRPDVATISDPAARVGRLFEILFSRRPSDAQQQKALAFLGPQPDAEAWRRLAHALLLTNEFVFID